jgi:superoxide reductase
MTELNQIYKCEVCGNIVEILHTGSGTLVCCDKPMVLQIEHDEDQGFEKHLPSLAFEGDTLTVTIGDTIHPMEEAHFIEWIEYIVNGQVFRKFLKPNDAPLALFTFIEADNYIVRAYCNVHRLWEIRM